MKNNFLLRLVLLITQTFLFSSCQQNIEESNQLKLWYKQPANASIPDNDNPWIDDP
jgi:hypothetical protein